jgi:hypothetical protein
VVGYLRGWVGERRRRAKGKGKMQETREKKEQGEEDGEKGDEDDWNVLRRVDAVSHFLSPSCSCVLKKSICVNAGGYSIFSVWTSQEDSRICTV